METIIIGEGIVELKFDSRMGIGELRNAKGEVVNAFGEMQNKAEKGSDAIGKAINIFAGAAALNSIRSFIKEVVSAGEAMNDMSIRFGVSVERLSRLKYAAEQSGLSVEEMATSIKFLSKNTVDAEEGNLDLRKAFDRLGISVKDANGQFKDGYSLLKETINKLNGVENSTERVRLATQLMGRSGDVILQMGGDLSKLEAEADKLGITMSTKSARAADEFGDALNRIKAQSLNNEFIFNAVPTWTSWLGELSDVMVDAGHTATNLFDVLGAVVTFNSQNTLGGILGLEKDFKFKPSDFAPTKKDIDAALMPYQTLMASFGTVADVTANKWGMTQEEIKKAADLAKQQQEELDKFLSEATGLRKGQQGPAISLGERQAIAGDYASGYGGMINTDQPFSVYADAHDKKMKMLEDENELLVQQRNLAQEKTNAFINGISEEILAARRKKEAELNAMGSIAEGMQAIADNNQSLAKAAQFLSWVQGVAASAAGWAEAFKQGGIYGFAAGAAMFAKMMALLAMMRRNDTGSSPQMKIPGAWEGGLIKEPAVIAVAERNPEVVIPLDKMGQMGGAGPTKIEVSVRDVPGLERYLAVRLVKRARNERLDGWGFAGA